MKGAHLHVVRTDWTGPRLGELRPDVFRRKYDASGRLELYYWAATHLGVDAEPLLDVAREIIEAVARDAGDSGRTRAAVADARVCLSPSQAPTRHAERGNPHHSDFPTELATRLAEAYKPPDPCPHCGEEPGEGAFWRRQHHVDLIATPVIREWLPDAAEAVDRRRRVLGATEGRRS